MFDLKFDIVTREIAWQNNDFVIEENPSEQNGGIILYSRAAIIQSPISGIGLEQVINSGLNKTTYEMNRWQQQVKQDGASVATWSATTEGNEVKINTTVSYE